MLLYIIYLLSGYVTVYAVVGWTCWVIRGFIRRAACPVPVWIPATWDPGHSERWSGWWVGQIWETQEKAGWLVVLFSSNAALVCLFLFHFVVCCCFFLKTKKYDLIIQVRLLLKWTFKSSNYLTLKAAYKKWPLTNG